MNKALLVFTVACAGSTLGFTLYHFISGSEKPAVKLPSGTDPYNNSLQVFFQKFMGVLFFGLIPAGLIMFFEPEAIKIIPLSPGKGSFLWSLILAAVILPLGFLNSRKPQNLAMYPSIRKRVWTPPLLVLSALAWILYLFAYEFMFRGMLLFSSMELMGLWPAIILNTGIYALVHVPKGITEGLGAIPFGLLLCWLAVHTGSFQVAFFAHVILALSNEWFSLWFHPEISLVCPLRNKRK